jgi:uncharacterized protein (DUF1015 family)
MPQISPFRGVRYDVARIGTLSDVVAPPYDVIEPALQDRLYESSPFNIVRLELNRTEPGDAAPEERYARAARLLRDWLRQGVLRQEDHAALYVYHQTFQVEGRTYTRKGFLARVRLEAFGQGNIYPHEQTLAGPKADRLALYHATGFNLSPIFGLYSDPPLAVQRAVESGVRDRTPLVATDHLGVESRLWVVLDQEVHTTVGGLMGTRPIFIADGHHRYETGLAYRDAVAGRGDQSGRNAPAEFCLMMLVSLSDPGLLILPTHRLVSGLPGLTAEELEGRLQGEFELRAMGDGESGCRAAWQAIESAGDQDLLGFGTTHDGRWTLARLRSRLTMDHLAATHSPAWRSLGVAVLHVLLLESLFSERGKPSCRYVHSIPEVLSDLAARGCDLACLVPPARMEHVQSIASNLETMPPKSTYFYPKLLTGLVLNPLRRIENT